jgi:PAS domain S-box-containing protein
MRLMPPADPAPVLDPLPLAALAATIDQLPDPIVVADARGVVRLVNGGLEALIGAGRDELVGGALADLLPERYRAMHGSHVGDAFSDDFRPRRMGVGLDVLVRHRDGREIPVEITLSIVRTTEGRMGMAAVRDVSERRAELANHRLVEQRLTAALTLARLGTWEVDLASGRRHYSAHLLQLLGRAESPADEEQFLDLVHPDDRAGVLEAHRRAIEHGEPFARDLRLRHADGSDRWVETVGRAIRGPNGEVRLHGLARDVTEERRAQRELIASRAELEAVVDNVPGVVLYLSLDWRVEFINRTLPGVVPEDVIGHPWTDFVWPDERPRVLAAFEEVRRTREPQEVETRSGGGRIFSSRLGPVLRDGEVVGLVVVSHDVTERRQAEARLATADRMAALGMIAAGIGHEVNNPLSVVVANLELALGGAGGLPALQDALDAARRVREIVRELSLFARAGRAPPAPIDPRPVVESTLRLVRNDLRHRARLETHLDEVPAVLADEGGLGQVVLNLLINAIQALPGAGDPVITVSTRTDGDRVRIEVADTGVGMSPVTLARAFQPFFTTKADGTGLGLAICHRIASGWGGELTAESELGQGSRFVLRLVRSEAPRAAPEPPAPAPAPLARPGRVLLVDDEEMLGRTLRRAIEPRHDAVHVRSAAEALELLEVDPGFDVVVCDLMMPGRSGMELYAVVERRWPELAPRFVFVTGGAFTPAAREFLARTAQPTLEKPFELRRLRELVDAGVAARIRAASR